MSKASRWRLKPVVAHPTDPALALVELTKGHFATISAVDAIDVGRDNWHVDGGPERRTLYAKSGGGDAGKREMLHRRIGRRIGIPDDVEVDHENGNGLDCRRSNLRAATPAQNSSNRRRPRNNTSGIKGVRRKDGRWVAELIAGGKRIWVGSYADMHAAAAAVAAARLRVHGEFANHGGGQ